MCMHHVNELISRLESEGEETVRRRLLEGVYDYDIQVRHTVEKWLLSKENERNEKRMNEHLAISKSAKRAAWAAAIAALIGAMFAIAAWIW